MLHDLYTPEGEALQGTPWQIYPRPQLKRNSYVNLNGIWDFAVSEKEEVSAFDKQINVPFCPESLLSGLKIQVAPGSYLFYRRSFTVASQTGRLLLHVGAADQVADIYVNQNHVCHHEGGYEAFCCDITDMLKAENELVIRCHDDLRDQTFPYGKQTIKRGGMWYTPVSGIWQTVWLESVPETYIEGLDIRVDLSNAVITTNPALDGKVICENKVYPLVNGKAVVAPENPRLWSPEDPYLYDFTVVTDQDRVDSYFAIRTISSQVVGGIPRLLLNGKPYFFHGLLDQGYWPDGLYTPAAPACYAQDILNAKQLGFNTLRKHIKVEAQEFYYQCDKLGMLVFQDMVNNGEYKYLRDTVLPTLGNQRRKDVHMHADPAIREKFIKGMEATVGQLGNHPCIVYWTIFNEGWGQFDSEAMYDRLKALDSSRIIDATSGWFRQKKSDVESIHVYHGMWHRLKKAEKPLILSEFGGYAYAVPGHLFHPGKTYGYKTCKSEKALQNDIAKLYREKITPAIKKGLCGAIYTQISDVEEEINGLYTFDRKVCKVEEMAMWSIAANLQGALAKVPVKAE